MASSISIRRRGRTRSVWIFIAALVTAVLPAAMPRVAVAASTIATDAFTRVVATGWANAESGGSYTYDPGNGAFSVDGAAGAVALNKAGANRGVYLNSAVARDVDVTVRFALDKLPVGSNSWTYIAVRRNGANEYRPKAIVNPNGTVAVQAGVVVSGKETSAGPAVVVTGLTPVAGAYIWLRTSVTGSAPTTIQVKAWADGTTEPASWQYAVTNSQAELQSEGALGLRAYVASVTNAPITESFDDLSATSLDAPAAPVAAFSATQEADTLAVDFTDQTTGSVDTWSWDFGDGSTSIDQNPTHTYAADGTYPVSLSVTGPGGSSSSSANVVVEPIPPPPPPPPPPTVVASDDFNRTATSLWAAAPEGGIWSYQGALADFSLSGTSADIRLPSPNQTRSAFLFSSLAQDVDLTFTVFVDKVAAGNSIYAYGTMRRTVDGFAYRSKLRFAANGKVFVQASKVTASGESPLGPEVLVPDLTQSGLIHLRAEAIGANPTTVTVRAWADGTTEPSVWQFSATDATLALQGAGSVGVLAYLSSGATNAPVKVSFDDFMATTVNPVDRVEGTDFTGAGDIASCTSQGDEQTARLLNLMAGDIFTLGDNAYPNGTATDFANCYDPSWGTVKSRTYPAIGNHEYNSAGAAPYFSYFGAIAGDPAKGYYAFNEGSWRIYVLNANCGIVACTPGSTQDQWLRADIAANPAQCSLAIWHQPRWSSGGEHGSNGAPQPLWQAAVDAGMELVLNGHDHDYERFAPQDATGALSATGTREFVVGTGGASHESFGSVKANSEVRNSTAYGVLHLVLGDGEYEWEFIPAAGQTFTDRGIEACH